MSQRWLFGAMGLLVAICLGLTVTVLLQMQEQRAAISDQQRLIMDTLDRLTRLSEEKANAALQPLPITPSSIKVKLTLDKPDGPPAAESSVSLMRVGVDKDYGPSIRCDDQGIVDFGYFEPAKYSISIHPKRSSVWTLTREFLLPLSTAHVEPVICPSESKQPIQWTVALPEDLQSQGVQSLLTWKCSLNSGGQDWRDLREQNRFQEFPFRSPDGETQRANLINSKSEWKSGGTTGSAVKSAWRQQGSSQPAEIPYVVLFYRSNMGPPTTMDFAGVRFQSIRLLLVAPAPLTDDRTNQQRGDFQLRLIPIAPPLGELAVEEGQPTRPGPPRSNSRKLQWGELKDEFVVAADKPNQWTIQVPDELIEQARAYLKEHPGATSDEPAK